MDLWQFYGYLQILRKKVKTQIERQYFENKSLDLLYILSSAWGLKQRYEDFFEGRIKIENLFKEKEDKNYDPLEGKGEYVEVDGEEVWVYNFEEIQEIGKFVSTINK